MTDLAALGVDQRLREVGGIEPSAPIVPKAASAWLAA